MAVAGRVLLATLAVLVATVPAGSVAARPAHRAVTVPAPPGGAAPVDGFRSVRTFDLVAEPARLRIPAVQVDTAPEATGTVSSSTRPRPRLRALGVLLALVPAGPTTVPLPGVTVLPVADRQVSLVVDIAGGPRPLPLEAVSVDVAGTRQPAMFVPVMSDQLAPSVVVDVSQAGGAGLASWLSGAARFVLDAPAGARTAVAADPTPPAALAPAPGGPGETLRQ